MLRSLQKTSFLSKRFLSSTPATLKKLYVGNMSFTQTDESVRELFSKHGEVTDVFIIKDRMTGRSRGFGFVEFSDDAQADAAVEALNGFTHDGRPLRVNIAEDKPRQENRPYQRSGSGGNYRDREEGRGDRGGYNNNSR